MSEELMEHGTVGRAKVNLAVVGVGYWGKNLVRNFYELDALGVICDADKSVEERCRSAYANVRSCRDFSAMLSYSSVVAVALATPATTHYEMAKAALEAGKDVFVEKPLAVEVKQGEDLVELAAAKHRILMVGHILQYHPAILKLQELIRDGGLGQINYLYSNRLNIGKIRTEENILWSFAPHDISVMLSLLNEMPSRVSCQGGAFLNRQIVDVTLSHFEFPSGVQAHVFVSWLHPVKEQRLVIVGSEKMAVFDDTGAEIGAGTKIWHFCHIMNGARIGERCNIGLNVCVDGGVTIGNNVKIQNNVSVYAGVVIEDDVFLGPSCVLTNVTNPRAEINRHSLYETTRLKRGCTVGANATIVCGVTIGRYAFIGAGSVVTQSVPDFVPAVGNPARQVGWISRHGHRLDEPDADGVMRCPESGYRYHETEPGVLRCLDLDDEAPLPAELRMGFKRYRQLKEEGKG